MAEEKMVKLKVREGFVAWEAETDKEGNLFEKPHTGGRVFEVPESQVPNYLVQCELIEAKTPAK
jgi:hypothetical protein